MTDKEKLIALLNEFGIEFVDNGTSIKCEEGMDKVGGYTRFFTDFEFSEDGKFVKMGAWE